MLLRSEVVLLLSIGTRRGAGQICEHTTDTNTLLMSNNFNIHISGPITTGFEEFLSSSSLPYIKVSHTF